MERELEFAKHAFDAGVEAVAVFDEELRFHHFNEPMAKVCGIPGADAVGKTFAEVFPALVDGPEEQALRRALQGDHAMHPPPFLGTKRREWLVHPLARTGRFVGAVLVARPPRAPGSRSEAEDMVCLLHAASHDLREPLRAVIAFADLLQRRAGAKLTPAEASYLERIRRGGLRMRDLVAALGDFAAARNLGQRERIDMKVLVGGMLEDMKLAVEDAGATVEVGTLPDVRANRRALGRVVKNLLSNALKFRNGDRVLVRIDAERMGDELHFRVEDDGMGFEPDAADRIFEMFVRLHPKDRFEGSGVGLALVRQVIEGHDGRVWAESTPGQGARFTFTLPATGERDTAERFVGP
jgi:signal transduction histidine kinase